MTVAHPAIALWHLRSRIKMLSITSAKLDALPQEASMIDAGIRRSLELQEEELLRSMARDLMRLEAAGQLKVVETWAAQLDAAALDQIAEPYRSYVADACPTVPGAAA